MLSHLVLLFSTAFIVCINVPLAAADDLPDATSPPENSIPLNLTYYRDIARSHISIGGETSQLTSATGQAIGIGPRAGFSYDFTPHWALAADLGFAFAATQKAGAFLYSGLNGTIQYSIFGSNLLSVDRVKQNGDEIVTLIPSLKRRVNLMLGLEQLFLNGTTSIYPAVGFLLGGVYTFGYLNHEFQIDLRYTSLTANNNPLTMITGGIGINLTL